MEDDRAKRKYKQERQRECQTDLHIHTHCLASSFFASHLFFCFLGEALLLHAKLYKWSDEKLGEISGEFPAQTQRERKEKLYTRAIDLFDKGKLFERAIVLIKVRKIVLFVVSSPLSSFLSSPPSHSSSLLPPSSPLFSFQELREEYQFGVYDYDKLSALLVCDV